VKELSRDIPHKKGVGLKYVRAIEGQCSGSNPRKRWGRRGGGVGGLGGGGRGRGVVGVGLGVLAGCLCFLCFFAGLVGARAVQRGSRLIARGWFRYKLISGEKIPEQRSTKILGLCKRGGPATKSTIIRAKNML